MLCRMKMRVTESRLCGTALSYMLEPRGAGMNDGNTVFFRSPKEREKKVGEVSRATVGSEGETSFHRLMPCLAATTDGENPFK